MTEPEIVRASLAGAFKGSGSHRTTGLGGILSQAIEGSTASPAPTPIVALAVTPDRDVAALEDGTPTVPVSASLMDAYKVENVPAYIEPDVLAAVRIAKRKGVPAGQPDLTYDELLLDAIDALGADRIREEFHPTVTDGAGLVARRPRRARGTGGVQIQLRLSKAQQQQLASLTESVAAPSRSAFVSMVFRLAYLKRR